MKKPSALLSTRHLIRTKILSRLIIPFAFSCLLLSTGCNDDDDDKNNISSNHYTQVNLVADSAGFGAAKIDANFSNSWGIAFGPSGNFWISGNHKGVSNVYDRDGNQKLPAVSIPSPGSSSGGAPTGVVFNNTADFIIPGSGPAKFIFAGEDGIVSAWSSGGSAVAVADRSSFDAVYKGITIANDGGSNFLYLANFKGQKIDVFDQNFNYVTSKPFYNLTTPSGYGPFNIQNINGSLYVTFAKLLAPDNEDDEKGPGNGYVNIYNPNGTLVKRFASQGSLNSPWAVVQAPSGFGKYKDAILIGNFGSGLISAFTTEGKYLGQLQTGGNTYIVIDGLWGLAFPQNNVPAGDPNQLFFTAGPKQERNGLFGYIKPN